MQRCRVRAGSLSDPWASHKSEIIGFHGGAASIHQGGLGGGAAPAGLGAPRRDDVRHSPGRALIGFAHLDRPLTLNCRPHTERRLSNLCTHTHSCGISNFFFFFPLVANEILQEAPALGTKLLVVA